MENVINAQIRTVTKMLLKKRGSGYAELGEALDLTVPAIKRLMTKGDFTISRVEKIAGWFGLTLFEFMSIAKDSVVRPYQFSEAQENILAKKSSALYLLLLLGAGLPLHEAQERAQVSEKQLQSDLFTLDKLGAIELGLENKVRIIARGPYKWIPGGPLQKKFFKNYLKQITNLVEVKPSENTLQLPFELYVSDRLVKQMQDDLRSVFEKYRSLSRIDHEISLSSELQPVTGLILIKPFDTWKAVLQNTDS